VQAACDWAFDVSMWFEVFDELVICNFKLSPTFLFNFHVDMSFVDERSQFVFIEDCFGYDCEWYSHVFVFVHRCVQVKILQVECGEFGASCGQDAIYHYFYSGNVGCFCAGLVRMVDEISTNSESDSS